MLNRTIGYASLIPRNGFRWLYRDRDGFWNIKEPPGRWAPGDSITDLSETDGLLQDAPHRTGFFLVAHFSAFAEGGKGYVNECEQDLYLKLASVIPNPATVLDFANRLGLLRRERSLIQITGEAAKELSKAYKWSLTGPRNDSILVRIESAVEWQQAFVVARRRLEDWAALEMERNYKEMSRRLQRQFYSATEGKLSYRVSLDPHSGGTYGEIFATSLAHLLDLQWAMSLEAGEVHRRCPECSTWFAVRPNVGRPEKQYCSDACRMRAYRKRKLSQGES